MRVESMRDLRSSAGWPPTTDEIGQKGIKMKIGKYLYTNYREGYINAGTQIIVKESTFRKELFNDSKVDFAGYKIEHPLLNEAIFTVTTTGKSPKTTIKSAITRIQKKLSDFEKEVKKLK